MDRWVRKCQRHQWQIKCTDGLRKSRGQDDWWNERAYGQVLDGLSEVFKEGKQKFVMDNETTAWKIVFYNLQKMYNSQQG